MKKIIGIIGILGILLIAIGVVGTTMVSSTKELKKEETSTNETRENKDKVQVNDEQTNISGSTTLEEPNQIQILQTSDEVLNKIKETDKDVKYVEEKEGCWKFKSNNKEYEYCKNEGILHEASSATPIQQKP